MKKHILTLSFVLFLTNTSLFSQDTSTHNYQYPLNTAPILSANFGELRENHFHSGIDMKTDGAVNKPVFAVEDGYISRISISEHGYGLALYIDHPSGQTSVYGHLNKFSQKIAEYVKKKQYEKESYVINIYVPKGTLSVEKGETIAHSGNTGSSFGPHVHFELRDTKSEETIDALPYFKEKFKDTTAPEIRGIAVYPIDNIGIVNNSSRPIRYGITKLKDGSFSRINSNIYAWGKIGVGIYAIDRMDNTHNVYGVKKVTLWCNDSKIFTSNINSFSFDHSRMINSLTDFDYWKTSKQFYMKAFIEPGNQLPIYESIDNGYINIDEEKEYKLQYLLEDAFGNQTNYNFTIIGMKKDFPEPALCSQAMAWNQNNYFVNNDFELYILKNSLYTDIPFTLNKNESKDYFSDIYMVNNNYVPLDKYSKMRVKLHTDTLSDKSQYGLVSLKGDKLDWVGGKYVDGFMQANIGELGNTYTVVSDKQSPIIAPNNPNKWIERKAISIKVTDDFSGIAHYRGTIDGQFALFEHDGKSDYYIYKFDDERLERNNTHHLVFHVVDKCGNKGEYKYEFYY